MENKYWASKDVHTEHYADELKKRIDDYYHYIREKGIIDIWRKSYDQFYKGYITGAQVNTHGENNELRKISANHYRSILQHLKVFTVQQRPIFQPRAINNDFDTLKQTILCKSILDYYWDNKNVENYTTESVDSCVKYGEGWVHTYWDFDKGETEKNIVDDEVVESTIGDICFDVHNPIDIVRDINLNNISDSDWLVVRKFENKYKIAAKYSMFADEIVALSIATDDDTCRMITDTDKIQTKSNDNDLIPVYTFYHKKNTLLPNGRKTVMAGDIVIWDGDLPYSNIPLHYIIPDKLDEKAFGYTIGFDLLPIQESIDMVYSTILSNQSAFGVQSILCPRGAGVDLRQLGGMNFIDYNEGAGKPEAYSPLATKPELFNFIGTLESLQNTLSGVNSVSRGNAPTNLKSGSALALMQSMAIQYNSQLQFYYAKLIENIGSTIVDILKIYAKQKRLVRISGKSNYSSIKEFSKEDISNIEEVQIDIGNPMTKSIDGRYEFAKEMLTSGMIKNPLQMVNLIRTGDIDSMLDPTSKQLLLIKQENEYMSAGNPVQALFTDKHSMHIPEHSDMLSDQSIRDYPELVQVYTDHIQEHIYLLETTKPSILMILGEQSLQTVQQPMEGSPEQSTGQPMPQQEDQLTDVDVGGVIPSEIESRLPNLPTNPLDGEQVG